MSSIWDVSDELLSKTWGNSDYVFHNLLPDNIELISPKLFEDNNFIIKLLFCCLEIIDDDDSINNKVKHQFLNYPYVKKFVNSDEFLEEIKLVFDEVSFQQQLTFIVNLYNFLVFDGFMEASAFGKLLSNGYLENALKVTTRFSEDFDRNMCILLPMLSNEVLKNLDLFNMLLMSKFLKKNSDTVIQILEDKLLSNEIDLCINYNRNLLSGLLCLTRKENYTLMSDNLLDHLISKIVENEKSHNFDLLELMIFCKEKVGFTNSEMKNKILSSLYNKISEESKSIDINLQIISFFPNLYSEFSKQSKLNIDIALVLMDSNASYLIDPEWDNIIDLNNKQHRVLFPKIVHEFYMSFSDDNSKFSRIYNELLTKENLSCFNSVNEYLYLIIHPCNEHLEKIFCDDTFLLEILNNSDVTLETKLVIYNKFSRQYPNIAKDILTTMEEEGYRSLENSDNLRKILENKEFCLKYGKDFLYLISMNSTLLPELLENDEFIVNYFNKIDHLEKEEEGSTMAENMLKNLPINVKLFLDINNIVGEYGKILEKEVLKKDYNNIQNKKIKTKL